jgi:hypothetical protein
MGNQLCKYKNIFGKPKEGIHSIRIFNIAVVDVLFTILGAFALHYALKISFTYCLAGLFLLGIFCHHIFCVDTTINRLLQ